MISVSVLPPPPHTHTLPWHSQPQLWWGEGSHSCFSLLGEQKSIKDSARFNQGPVLEAYYVVFPHRAPCTGQYGKSRF